MMNTKKAHFVAAGLAIFSPFVTAAEPPEPQAQTGNLAYVGSNGRIGVGYDTKPNSTVRPTGSSRKTALPRG
ncbi:MAG: hypothetical protein PHZ14_05080 [Sulfuricella sp.]|nr:hypothetical protein [Sulfuricella sp.]